MSLYRVERYLRDLDFLFEETFKARDSHRVLEGTQVTLSNFMIFGDETVSEEGEPTLMTVRDKIADEAKPLTPNGIKIPTVCIDSHSTIIGKSEDGDLAAYKVAIVVEDRGKLGGISRTYLCFIDRDPAWRKNFYNDIIFREILGYRKTKRVRPPERVETLADRCRFAIERHAQLGVSSSFRKTNILHDGALVSSTVDTPTGTLENILWSAISNGNSTLAISKYSTLTTMSGELVQELLYGVEGPCYANVNDYIPKKYYRRLCGIVHAVKFAQASFGPTFRVDIKPIKDMTCDEALSSLVSSASFELAGSYPAVAELAHVYAKFIDCEILSLQLKACLQFDIRIRVKSALDIRELILKI